MNDLAAFITARLDEDEAAAKAAAEFDVPPWRADWAHNDGYADLRSCDGGFIAYDEGTLTRATALHIARHDPARVLREVAAKRARLAYYEHAQAMLDHIIAHPGSESPGDQGMWLGKTAAARMACRYDAAIWSDHGDYRPEWAPQP